MTPKEYYSATIGKSIDTDGAYGPQCWDYFDYFCRLIGFDGSRYCASTGYVGDLWMLRDAVGYNYSTDFFYVTDPAQFRTGDWIFWQKHVAMYYDGLEVGQNQPQPYVTAKEMSWPGVLGAMRWKGWSGMSIGYGKSRIQIGEHSYSLWRMVGSDRIGVVSAGLNKVASIRELDADVLVEAKITSANYHQAKKDQADPYGTTYGDLSAPLSGVYQNLPNQDSTLFYDLETGQFGDCSDVNINSSHNVFSPSLVFPNSKGNWEYARMVGLSHKDKKSTYTFVVRFADGYALGAAEQESTPQEIADDFSQSGMINIAFLDGGVSAQAAFWYDDAMHYDLETGAECSSAIIVYRMPQDPVMPQEPEVPEEVPEEEEDDMPEEEKPTEEITPIPGWTDPETGKTIPDRISALLSVKSIITLVCLFLFAHMVMAGEIGSDQFMTVFSVVVAFYFGTTFSKGAK